MSGYKDYKDPGLVVYPRHKVRIVVATPGKRAIHVAQQLIKLGLDPKTITAAGRSYYDPVVTNTTEANKAKNRRTEIIIIPKS